MPRLSSLYRPGVYVVVAVVMAIAGLAVQTAGGLPDLGDHQFTAGAADDARAAAGRVLAAIAANPAPVVVALLTFAVTVVYHTAKGRSLREAVEAAATRTTPPAVVERLVPINVSSTGPPDSPIVARAKARATWTQLVEDQTGLQRRREKLPEDLRAAEQLAARTQQQLAAARTDAEEKERIHAHAAGRVATLHAERVRADVEWAQIERELDRLRTAV